MSAHGVVLFFTSSSAIRAEMVMQKEAAWAVKLIPTPRELSSDCGMALRFEWGRADDVRRLLEENNVEHDGLHRI